MLSNKKHRDVEENKRKKTASFKYDLDGLTIELNLTINIYNTNENANNLANQGGKAGITLTAAESGQISGDCGANNVNGEEIEEMIEQTIKQSEQMIQTDKN